MLPSTGRGAALYIRSTRSDAVRVHTTSASSAEVPLVRALCSGDEAGFAVLVDRHHLEMLRLAGVYVRDRAVAEEVAQGTWLAALNSIARFEGRSSVKTWLFRILVNVAMKRAFGSDDPFRSRRRGPKPGPTRRPLLQGDSKTHLARTPIIGGGARELARQSRGMIARDRVASSWNW